MASTVRVGLLHAFDNFYWFHWDQWCPFSIALRNHQKVIGWLIANVAVIVFCVCFFLWLHFLVLRVFACCSGLVSLVLTVLFVLADLLVIAALDTTTVVVAVVVIVVLLVLLLFLLVLVLALALGFLFLLFLVLFLFLIVVVVLVVVVVVVVVVVLALVLVLVLVLGCWRCCCCCCFCCCDCCVCCDCCYCCCCCCCCIPHCGPMSKESSWNDRVRILNATYATDLVSFAAMQPFIATGRIAQLGFLDKSVKIPFDILYALVDIGIFIVPKPAVSWWMLVVWGPGVTRGCKSAKGVVAIGPIGNSQESSPSTQITS